MSAAGYVKTVKAEEFRTQSRGGRGVTGAALKRRGLHHEGDPHVSPCLPAFLFQSRAGSIASRPTRYRSPAAPLVARPSSTCCRCRPDERMQAIIDTRDYETNRYLFFATKKGRVKKTRFNEYDSSLRAGIIAIRLNDGDELVAVLPTNGSDAVFMSSRFWSDDPLLRRRCAAYGPHRGRRRGNALPQRRRARFVRRGPRRSDAI